MSRRNPLPRSIDGEPFGTVDACARGVTRNRLRAHDLVAPHLGVRSHEAPTGTIERAAAYRPLLDRDQCLSHTTAAVLYGIPVPGRVELDPLLHVSTIGDDRRPRRPGVLGHRLQSGSIYRLRRLPILDPVTT